MELKKKRSLIPVVSSQITSMVSVALVLFIIGILALASLATHRFTASIMEQVGFVAVMDDNVTDAQAQQIQRFLASSRAVASFRYVPAEEVLNRWKRDMGVDDDLDALLLGVNPFFPEVEVTLRANYVHPDSMRAIGIEIEQMPGVSSVKMNTETAREVGDSLRSIIIVLLFVAITLLLISFVLINNTIRLGIYSRRFQIHTMKLVGATAGFIRAPFVARNILGGAIAGIIASGALAGAVAYIANLEPMVYNAVYPADFLYVALGLIVTGIIVCALAALFATNRYIRISYDAMFR